MTKEELLRAELMMWKAIATSRGRSSDHMSRCFDAMYALAQFYKSKAPDDIELPDMLRVQIEELTAT